MMGGSAPMIACSCGAYYSTQDKFCKECGTSSPYFAGGGGRNALGGGHMVECQCGAVLPASQRFCQQCGSSLQQSYQRGAFYGGGQQPYGAPVGARDPGRRERVLVVDDDPDMLAYVRRVLELEFYEVQVAQNGQEGMNMAIMSPPDLMILDVSMPGIDGVTLCRKLRANNQTRSTPIILLTGLVGVDDEARGLEAGADDYLLKPVNPARLVARVESHLRRARLRRH